MALAALFAIIMAAGMAYKMMVKQEPLDVLKLFRPLAVSIVLCWWYPPADTGMAGSGSSWCFLDFLSYIPNCIGSYTHDLYEAEASQISDKFEEVQELIHVRDTMYTSLQARADVAHTGTSDPNLIEATMEQTGVDEVTNMEKDAAELWFTSLTAGVVVGIDKIIMLIALVVFRIGWWATIYCQQILLGMLTVFGPLQWAFSLLPKWEGAWAKWLTRYLTVHFYGAMLYFVRLCYFITIYISSIKHYIFGLMKQTYNKNIIKCCVCFRGCFSVCQNQIPEMQMLNLHFSLLPFDWHFNPLFIPCYCCFFVRQNRHAEDMAKVTNFRWIASLYASDIHKKLIDGIIVYSCGKKERKLIQNLPQNCSYNIPQSVSIKSVKPFSNPCFPKFFNLILS